LQHLSLSHANSSDKSVAISHKKKDILARWKHYCGCISYFPAALSQVDIRALDYPFFTVYPPKPDVFKAECYDPALETGRRDQQSPANVVVADLSEDDTALADYIDHFPLHSIQSHQYHCQMSVNKHYFQLCQLSQEISKGHSPDSVPYAYAAIGVASDHSGVVVVTSSQ
jgi:hypothetical protein